MFSGSNYRINENPDYYFSRHTCIKILKETECLKHILETK